MTRLATAGAVFALIGLGALAAGPALAESHRLEAAWEAAISEEADDLAPGLQAGLNLVAYHAAVARLCDGFEVDDGKIAEESNAIITEALEGLDGEALYHRHAVLLIDMGVRHGLFLAESSLHPQRFCADAEEVRASEDYEHHWR